MSFKVLWILNLFLTGLLLYQEVWSVSLTAVWRPVFIPQSVPTSGSIVSAKNAIQCIQNCLESDGCLLSCFDGENCELSKIFVDPGSSGGTRSCYTRLKINYAIGANWKGPPHSDNRRILDNLKDGITVFDMNEDCFISDQLSIPLYVMIDMKREKLVNNISLTSQPNKIASHLFQDIEIFVGNSIDEKAMDEGNFDLLELIGITKSVQVVGETQIFVLDLPKSVQYVVLHKTGYIKLQVCDIIISWIE